jgi:hypothetical protein
MQVSMGFVHNVRFCIFVCESVGLQFLFSLEVNDNFDFEHGVSFKVCLHYFFICDEIDI